MSAHNEPSLPFLIGRGVAVVLDALRFAARRPYDAWLYVVEVSCILPILVGSLLMILAPLLLGYEMFEWLKRGKWLGWSTEDALGWVGLERPVVQWLGAQQIIDWMMDFPAPWMVFFLGMALVLLAIWASTEAEEARKKEQAKVVNA